VILHSATNIRRPHSKFAKACPVQGSAFKLHKWVQLTIQSIIAMSLAALAAVAVFNSLALHGATGDEDPGPVGCEQPRFRSELCPWITPLAESIEWPNWPRLHAKRWCRPIGKTTWN
jgi:hypothetical protein